MPSVVRIATVDAAISISMTPLDPARARNSNLIRLSAKAAAPSATSRAIAPPIVAKRLVAPLICGASVVISGLNPASILPEVMSCASPNMLSRWISLRGSARPSGDDSTVCSTKRD